MAIEKHYNVDLLTPYSADEKRVWLNGGKQPRATEHGINRDGDECMSLSVVGSEAVLLPLSGSGSLTCFTNAYHANAVDISELGSSHELDDHGIVFSARVETSGGVVPLHDPSKTSAKRFFAEVSLPFLLAGLGMVAAGLLLGKVQHWRVFRDVTEMFIMIPALLGLKGNLEMTLAARLSTLANLGGMDTFYELRRIVVGNVAVTQVQATVVGFLAAVTAMLLSWIPRAHFNLLHALLLAASSVCAAVFTCLVLSLLMVFLIVLSRRCGINPDHVAIPLAASLGDITSLFVLSWVSHGFYTALLYGTPSAYCIAPVCLGVILCLLPVWAYISYHNQYARPVLTTGWVAILTAMLISSFGGLILDHVVTKFDGMANFQPVINGVGGNLAAIQASRTCTTLHFTFKVSPNSPAVRWPTPCKVFCNRVAAVLVGLVVPGQLIFILVIYLLKTTSFVITPLFCFLYVTACLTQVVLLLYIGAWLVFLIWRRGLDPDTSAIPLITALGDLIGTGLLALVFYILSQHSGPSDLGVEVSTEVFWNTSALQEYAGTIN